AEASWARLRAHCCSRFFFQAEDGIRAFHVTGVQTCALPIYFAVELRWLPASGFVPLAEDPVRWARSLLLPVLALGLGQAAVMTRMTRAAMLDVLDQDFVRTARSKGLPESGVVLKHALRNAMVTIVTILGLSLSNVFIGSIVIEQVFALPGLGRLALTAIGTRDFPLLQGEILLYAAT